MEVMTAMKEGKKNSEIKEGTVPVTFRFNEKTSTILNRVYLVELIAKSSNPFLTHDSAVRALLEEHYGKPFDQLWSEYEARTRKQ